MRLERSYAVCPGCGQGSFPAQRLLGAGGWLTPRALEMACRAGIHDPFRKAEGLLRDLAGWSVDAETLRRRCHEQAALACAGRAGRAGLPAAFARAGGDYELHIDAGKVNTVEGGWRDLKVAVAARRARGPASSPEDFGRRQLPAPAVRSVVAAVEGREGFGRRAEAEALRLGLPLGAGLSVLGDGAAWVWELAADHFRGAACVLDFWHAAEHLAAAGRAALGEGAALQAWLAEAKRLLAADGYAGAVEALARPLAGAAARRRLDGAAGEALNYFAGQRERLGYAARLRRGQAIGSGAVEGAIKQLLNIRMKRTGARWRVDRVGPFVELIALADGPEWDEWFAAQAA